MAGERFNGWEGSVKETKLILGKLSDEEIARVAGGIVGMFVYDQRPLDKFSFAAYFKAISESGRFSREQLESLITRFGYWDERLDATRAQEGDLFEDARELGRRNDLGLVGFIHGHYRRLTIGHMFSFIEANRQCDALVIALESNERSERFKGKEVLLTDEQRIKSVLIPPFANFAGLIRGEEYDDDYYRELVAALSPDIYFGSQEFDQERKSEWNLRAESVGGQAVFLPHFPSISTTIMEELGKGDK